MGKDLQSPRDATRLRCPAPLSAVAATPGREAPGDYSLRSRTADTGGKGLGRTQLKVSIVGYMFCGIYGMILYAHTHTPLHIYIYNIYIYTEYYRIC